MRHPLLSVIGFCALMALLVPVPARAQGGPLVAAYRRAADSVIRAATRDSAAYDRVGRLVDGFGHRHAGSRSLEAAIDWILAEMKRDGLQNVRGEPVKVTRWVRGEESVVLVRPRRDTLGMLGLGGSVGDAEGGDHRAGAGGLELRRAGAADGGGPGKIVLFDAPFTNYPETRHYRTDGPSAAAQAGAVACLIRSVASYSIRSPHTGRTSYDSTAPKIPAAALSVEDAMMLHRMQDRGEQMVVTLGWARGTFPPAQSRNVVAELVGREKPDEMVVLGGHIDSWDVGQGAMDDAGGSVAAWEAVRLMQRTRTPAPTHGPRGAMDQRGERGRRRQRLSRCPRARSWTSTWWRWSRTAACSSRRDSTSRARTAPPRWCGRRPRCYVDRRDRPSSRWTEPRGRHRSHHGTGVPGISHLVDGIPILLVSSHRRGHAGQAGSRARWRSTSRPWR